MTDEELAAIEKACAEARGRLSCSHAIGAGQLCADCWKAFGTVPALVAEVRRLRGVAAEEKRVRLEAQSLMLQSRTGIERAEREACAILAEKYVEGHDPDFEYAGIGIAAAIRARGGE